jgi:hypothetical protein
VSSRATGLVRVRRAAFASSARMPLIARLMVVAGGLVPSQWLFVLHGAISRLRSNQRFIRPADRLVFSINLM